MPHSKFEAVMRETTSLLKHLRNEHTNVWKEWHEDCTYLKDETFCEHPDHPRPVPFDAVAAGDVQFAIGPLCLYLNCPYAKEARDG